MVKFTLCKEWKIYVKQLKAKDLPTNNLQIKMSSAWTGLQNNRSITEKPLFLMSREQIKKKYGNNVFKKAGKGDIKEVL